MFHSTDNATLCTFTSGKPTDYKDLFLSKPEQDCTAGSSFYDCTLGKCLKPV